ncbi:MAG: hypothetical protein ACFB4J_11230 [Elainellaceae cyanobacterium]
MLRSADQGLILPLLSYGAAQRSIVAASSAGTTQNEVITAASYSSTPRGFTVLDSASSDAPVVNNVQALSSTATETVADGQAVALSLEAPAVVVTSQPNNSDALPDGAIAPPPELNFPEAELQHRPAAVDEAMSLERPLPSAGEPPDASAASPTVAPPRTLSTRISQSAASYTLVSSATPDAPIEMPSSIPPQSEEGANEGGPNRGGPNRGELNQGENGDLQTGASAPPIQPRDMPTVVESQDNDADLPSQPALPEEPPLSPTDIEAVEAEAVDAEAIDAEAIEIEEPTDQMPDDDIEAIDAEEPIAQIPNENTEEPGQPPTLPDVTEDTSESDPDDTTPPHPDAILNEQPILVENTDGNRVIDVSVGQTVIVTGFTGVGKGPTPENPIEEIDVLRFDGIGLTANNLILTRFPAQAPTREEPYDLVITFEGVANTQVILRNFALEELDNLGSHTQEDSFTIDGVASPVGNILFDDNRTVVGDGEEPIEIRTIDDSFDVFDAPPGEGEEGEDYTERSRLFRPDSVTFLHEEANTVHGFDEGNDTIHGLGGSDALYGAGGNDTLYGGLDNDDLYGQAGNDILVGGAGNDILIGGDGNDRLIGGAGDDQLTGGSGTDTFVLTSDIGTDTITDFTIGEDLIELEAGLNWDDLTVFQGISPETNNVYTEIFLTGQQTPLAIISGSTWTPS